MSLKISSNNNVDLGYISETDSFSLALEKIQSKNPSFNYTQINLGEGFPEPLNCDQFAIIFKDTKGNLKTNRSLIWVDRNKREIIFLDAAGRLASFYKIDLNLIKDQIFPNQAQPVKLIQKQPVHSSDNQQLLNFIQGKCVDCAKFDSSVPHRGASVFTNDNGYSVYRSSQELPRKIAFNEWTEDLAVSNTVLAGTRKAWDPVRLRTGKERKLEQIGAKKLILQTPSSAEINASYFSYDCFMDSLEKMDVRPVAMRISATSPILTLSKPIQVQSRQDGKWESAVLIPYSEDNKELFQDLTSLQAMAARLNMQVMQRDFTPLPAPNSKPQWPFSLFFSTPQAPKQDLIIVYRDIARNVERNHFYDIQDAQDFSQHTLVFAPHSHEVQGFILPEDPTAKQLLEELKIQQSSWRLVENLGGNNTYLIPNEMHDMLLSFSDLDVSNYVIHSTPLKPLASRQRGVALLSMNQTDSYFQYPHEILSLLLNGVNVMAYDNCGKGLSRGINSKKSLLEQIETVYQYLIDVEGFSEEQILVKSQCASGPLASELAKRHPQITLFLDQVPNNYQEMVPHLYSSYLKQFKDQLLRREQTLTNRVATQACDFFSDSEFAPKMVTQFLPTFDVADNLKYHKGPKLFLIATEDEQGKGGDQLVPETQRDQIVETMALSQDGHHPKKTVFMAIPGGGHITPWMTTSDLATPISRFMQTTQIAQPLFETEDPLKILPSKNKDEIRDQFEQLLQDVETYCNKEGPEAEAFLESHPKVQELLQLAREEHVQLHYDALARFIGIQMEREIAQVS